MRKLFTGHFESLISFIFNLYDFDKDGLISKEDIRIVLSYVPLEVDTKYSSFRKFDTSEFKDRVESQEELHILLEKVFKNNDTIDLKKFTYAIENVSSDILLFILIFLMKKKPFSANLIEEFASKHNGGEMPKSPTFSKKLIASPNLLSKFASSKIILNSPSFKDSKISKKSPSRLGQDFSLENNQTSKNLLLKFTSSKSQQLPNENDEKIVTLSYGNKGDLLFYYFLFLF
jgi:hypothetical protein